MKTGKLADTYRGWFIGDFAGALHRTGEVEVAVKRDSASFLWRREQIDRPTDNASRFRRVWSGENLAVNPMMHDGFWNPVCCLGS